METMKVYYYGGELYHHGVLGQKWGVRRYQNPDGSLTDEGRKHYLKGKYGSGIKEVAGSINTRQRHGKSVNAADVEKLRTIDQAVNIGFGSLAGVGAGLNAISAVAGIMSGVGAIPVATYIGASAIKAGLAKHWIGNAKKLRYASVDDIREYADLMKKKDTKQAEEYSRRYDEGKNVKADQGDSYYRDKAKKYGLDQGDNYKMFRDADQGDAKAKAAVEKWKKDKIDSRVKNAMSTDKFDMEFLEKGLDQDDRTGELLKGKRLETAYRKYLEEEYSK